MALLKSLAERDRQRIAVEDVVSLESGISFASAITGGMRHSFEAPPVPADVVDGAGHRRPIYPALLVYAWLRTVEINGLDWKESLMPWCELLASRAMTTEISASSGWNALALTLAGERFGRRDWSTLSATTFKRLAAQQQSSGALFPPSNSENPETRWYDELVLLHAMSSYAVTTGDIAISAAVERATEFHLLETQPDHASQQPWAVFAFFANPNTRIQAEQIFHSAVMQRTTNLDAVSIILLADALWCLRRTQARNAAIVSGGAQHRVRARRTVTRCCAPPLNSHTERFSDSASFEDQHRAQRNSKKRSLYSIPRCA